MKFGTFAAFVGPSLLMMFLFIALPLGSVFLQSFQVTQQKFETVEVETCTPGFPNATCVTEARTRPIFGEDGSPLTETAWVGLQSYRNVLEMERVRDALSNVNFSQWMTIDFWKALRFTLTFTLITLPLVLGMGLLIALVDQPGLQVGARAGDLRLAPADDHHAGHRRALDPLALHRRRHPDLAARAMAEPRHRDVRPGLDDRADDDALPRLARRALRRDHLLRRPPDREPGHARKRRDRRRQHAGSGCAT